MDDTLPSPLPFAHLAAIAEGLAGARSLWLPHAARHPSARTSARLIGTDAWEAWVLGWAAGHGVELHDHGGSAGAFTVVEGTLVELLAPSPSRVVRHEHRPGAVIAVGADTVHHVVNAGPD